jgi:amidophosphoribosyltransferase
VPDRFEIPWLDSTGIATADGERIHMQIFASFGRLHERVCGSYAVIALIAEHGLLAFRDPLGISPLTIGRRVAADGHVEWAIASESLLHESGGYGAVRDIAPGEAVFITTNGEMFASQCAKNPRLVPCAFEFVYLARPDSVMSGISVYEARLRLGNRLADTIARFAPRGDIDVIMPIPDSSRPAAMQVAQKLGIEYREGFFKNRYVGRTFIMPGQALRRKSVRLKLNALIAHGRRIPEIAAELGADYLIYQEVDDMLAAITEGSRVSELEMSCFTGEYVTGWQHRMRPGVRHTARRGPGGSCWRSCERWRCRSRAV